MKKADAVKRVHAHIPPKRGRPVVGSCRHSLPQLGHEIGVLRSRRRATHSTAWIERAHDQTQRSDPIKRLRTAVAG